VNIKSVLSGVASSARNPVGTGLTALERSADLSPNSNVPLAIDLNVTIQMRVTIIDRMNKNPVNPVIPSEKLRRRRLNFCFYKEARQPLFFFARFYHKLAAGLRNLLWS